MEHHEATDGLHAPALVVWGVVAAIGTFVIIVGLQALFLNFQSEQEAKQNTVTSATSLLAEQRAKINRYGWLDRENGVVAIPIDRAIELTAQEMRRDSDERTKK
jgi:hypothetical protein